MSLFKFFGKNKKIKQAPKKLEKYARYAFRYAKK